MKTIFPCPPTSPAPIHVEERRTIAAEREGWQGLGSERVNETENSGEKRAAELGRLVPPYPVEHCSNVECPHRDDPLGDEHGAYLYRDLNTQKLVVFCGDCARYVEINASARFLLVPL